MFRCLISLHAGRNWSSITLNSKQASLPCSIPKITWQLGHKIVSNTFDFKEPSRDYVILWDQIWSRTQINQHPTVVFFLPLTMSVFLLIAFIPSALVRKCSYGWLFPPSLFLLTTFDCTEPFSTRNHIWLRTFPFAIIFLAASQSINFNPSDKVQIPYGLSYFSCLMYTSLFG